MIAAISAGSRSKRSACWRMMSSCLSGRVTSRIASPRSSSRTISTAATPSDRDDHEQSARRLNPAVLRRAASVGDQLAEPRSSSLEAAVVADHVGRPRGLLLLRSAGARCGPRARRSRERRRARPAPASGATTQIVASNSDSIPVSNSSGTSITASRVAGSSPARQATIRSPTSGCRVDSSQRSSSGRSNTIAADPGAVDRAVGSDLVAPALDQQVADALGRRAARGRPRRSRGSRRRGARARPAPRSCRRRSRRSGRRPGSVRGAHRAAATALGSSAGGCSALGLGAASSAAVSSTTCSAGGCGSAAATSGGRIRGGRARRLPPAPPRAPRAAGSAKTSSERSRSGAPASGSPGRRLVAGLQLRRDQVAERKVVVAPARA